MWTGSNGCGCLTRCATDGNWIGTYSTSWKNCEAVSIWALEKGWDTLAEHYSRDPTGDVELKTWMSIAIALRERYDDGLLHALPPTPLK